MVTQVLKFHDEFMAQRIWLQCFEWHYKMDAGWPKTKELNTQMSSSKLY